MTFKENVINSLLKKVNKKVRSIPIQECYVL